MPGMTQFIKKTTVLWVQILLLFQEISYKEFSNCRNIFRKINARGGQLNGISNEVVFFRRSVEQKVENPNFWFIYFSYEEVEKQEEVSFGPNKVFYRRRRRRRRTPTILKKVFHSIFAIFRKHFLPSLCSRVTATTHSSSRRLTDKVCMTNDGPRCTMGRRLGLLSRPFHHTSSELKMMW